MSILVRSTATRNRYGPPRDIVAVNDGMLNSRANEELLKAQFNKEPFISDAILNGPFLCKHTMLCGLKQRIFCLTNYLSIDCISKYNYEIQ